MASFLFSVNGKLSQWSNWTRCDKLCEHGKERRYKTCSNPKPRCGGKNCDLSISVEDERPCMYCPGNYNALLEHVFKGFLDLERCPTLNFSFPCATNSISWLHQFFIRRKSARSFSGARRTRKIAILYCTSHCRNKRDCYINPFSPLNSPSSWLVNLLWIHYYRKMGNGHICLKR